MQALYLNCPELNDLNLNSCKNLHPGMLFDASFLDNDCKFLFFIIKHVIDNQCLYIHRETVTSVPQIRKCACIRLSRVVGWGH